MIDLASIRNASFTLTPTGYNPEEVDQFLADLADQLADQLSAPPAAAPAPEPVEAPVFAIEQPVAAPPAPEPLAAPQLPEPVVQERPTAELDRLQRAVESTIGAMEAFVHGELASVRQASNLEVDDIHRERERLLQEAGDAARAHLDETRARADRMLDEAREEADALRRRAGAELQSERERFEQALADRDAQAQARIAEIVAEAEDRRREAEEQVTAAERVQSQVLASLEQARASLFPAAPTMDGAYHAEPPAEEPVRGTEDPFGFPTRPSSLQSALAERSAEPGEAPSGPDGTGATDAAA
jgi:DivIVA domain-containing protein